MQTTYLQQLASILAAQITVLGNEVDDLKNEAKVYKSVGEVAYSIQSYKERDRVRAKLAKLVQTQRAIKAELTAAFATARLPGKIQLLETKTGMKWSTDNGLTSKENEARLDAAIDSLVPKKADTRPVDHPSFKK